MGYKVSSQQMTVSINYCCWSKKRKSLLLFQFPRAFERTTSMGDIAFSCHNLSSPDEYSSILFCSASDLSLSNFWPSSTPSHLIFVLEDSCCDPHLNMRAWQVLFTFLVNSVLCWHMPMCVCVCVQTAPGWNFLQNSA